MANFTSIESYAKMFNYQSLMEENDGIVNYALKPKLHGTFAKIEIEKNYVRYYSKNRELSDYTPDNAGFRAAHVDMEEGIKTAFSIPNKLVTIYGEWCGKGIHKAPDAVCQLDKKVFFVFAVSVDDTMMTGIEEYDFAIRTLGWFPLHAHSHFNIDFSHAGRNTQAIQWINDAVALMEEKDVFMKINFGVTGVGEGYVGAPYPICSIEEYDKYVFKAKTQAHRVKKTGLSVQEKEPMPVEVVQFVDMMVTKARVQQAIDETNALLDMSDTPKILKWCGQDIQKEGQEELESLGMEWKQVAKAVNAGVVRIWKGMVLNEKENEKQDA